MFLEDVLGNELTTSLKKESDIFLFSVIISRKSIFEIHAVELIIFCRGDHWSPLQSKKIYANEVNFAKKIDLRVNLILKY